MADGDQLWILTEIEDIDETVIIEGQRSGRRDTGGGFDPNETVEKITVTRRKRVSIDAQLVKAQMESMLAIVNDLFSQAETTTGLRLDEVELSVDISAEGQISIVGNGGKLGNSGGIKLKFTRPV
ncbi:MAG TPA: hypothetical protein V6D20_16135 [Candidatus Obscuribacterales bacterium]